MDVLKILTEGYITFGIMLSYAIAIIVGVLIGERYTERENNNEQQKLQSNKKIVNNERKFTFME